MKLSFVLPPRNFLKDLIKPLEELGHEILINKITPDCDVMIGWSISQMPTIKDLHKKCPKVPMIQYNWDVYEWVWKHPRGKDYDFKGYGELMRESLEVWCPSRSVVLRNKEFFNLDNSFIIKTFSLFYDEPVSDNGFILMPLRQIPDRNRGWFEKVMEELDIPHQITDKRLSWGAYKKTVASCSFIVCPWYEASTGGLSLLEGYRLGKPVLVSDSPYMGARDYFGEKANYFQYHSYPNFKKLITNMWRDRIELDIVGCREFTNQYKVEVMAQKISSRLEEIIK